MWQNDFVHTCLWHVTEMSSVMQQNANESERQYKLSRSRMNVHKINISSLPTDQLLHLDITISYPDTSLRLFPITVFFR